MKRLERLGWRLGGLLPAVGWALLIGFVAVSFSFVPPLVSPISGRSLAWLSALLVLLWLAFGAERPRHD